MSRDVSNPDSGSPVSAAAPTSPRERITTVDIVRGFALLGVVLVNWQGWISWENLDGMTNLSVVWLFETFVLGNFYRLFAFLFGLGFVLQMTRLESRGVRFAPLYLRRLAILFLFGLVHGILFMGWNDILSIFAQYGVLLLLIRRMSNKSIFVMALVCLLASHTYYYVSTGFADFRKGEPMRELVQERQQRRMDGQARRAETARIRSQGSFREVVEWNAWLFSARYGGWGWEPALKGQLKLLGEEGLMCLLGLYAGRRRVFENVRQARPFFRKAMWWALSLGVLGYLISMALSALQTPPHGHLAYHAKLIVEDIDSAAFALFYASAVVLLVQRAGWKRLLKPVAAIGRMALTNYLLLSIIITTVFFSYGFGLDGKVDLLAGVGLAVMTYIVQLLWSSWWLNRFRFGPAEWLWRSLTYGERQSLVIRSG